MSRREKGICSAAIVIGNAQSKTDWIHSTNSSIGNEHGSHIFPTPPPPPPPLPSTAASAAAKAFCQRIFQCGSMWFRLCCCCSEAVVCRSWRYNNSIAQNIKFSHTVTLNSNNNNKKPNGFRLSNSIGKDYLCACTHNANSTHAARENFKISHYYTNGVSFKWTRTCWLAHSHSHTLPHSHQAQQANAQTFAF